MKPAKKATKSSKTKGKSKSAPPAKSRKAAAGTVNSKARVAKKNASSAKKAKTTKKVASKPQTTKNKTKAVSKKTTKKATASKARKAATVKTSKASKAKIASAKSSNKTSAEKAKPRRSNFTAAVKVYESGFKLMHAEKFEKARETFASLVDDYPEETELLDRAHVLIHVCQKRLREAKKSPKLKSADDFYEFAVAEMNRRELDDALDHLQQALRMSPRADHVLYALAAVSALRNERDQALEFLQQSIKYRDENRFLAINDVDFESLSDDPEFIQLITPDEG